MHLSHDILERWVGLVKCPSANYCTSDNLIQRDVVLMVAQSLGGMELVIGCAAPQSLITDGPCAVAQRRAQPAALIIPASADLFSPIAGPADAQVYAERALVAMGETP